MWALFNETVAAEGVWGFFSACTAASGPFEFTTSAVCRRGRD